MSGERSDAPARRGQMMTFNTIRRTSVGADLSRPWWLSRYPEQKVNKHYRAPGVERGTFASSIFPVTAIDYTFLNVHVTFPKASLSPSLTGVALSGSRRLPLMRVELVLFRSVTV
jgi:hypothetical protein